MKTLLITFLVFTTIHFGYCQSISLISNTGYSNSRLYERPLSFGLGYNQTINKIQIGGELLYSYLKPSTEKTFEYVMIDMIEVPCDVTVKTNIYSINAYLSFCLRNNENVAIFLGPKIGLSSFDGTKNKYFYSYSGSEARNVAYKLDNKLKPSFGINFQTEIKKVIFDNLSVLLDFNSKWLFIQNSMDLGGIDTGPTSIILTSFGIGLQYNFNK